MAGTYLDAPSQRGFAFVLVFLSVVFLTGSFVAAGARADRVAQGSLCTTSGIPALGGTCNNPRGVAVNSSGNGGVPAGTIYVVDGTNNRIQRFSPGGQFVSAWGRDVIGVNEQQTVTVSATAGQFKLTFGGQTTGNIAFNASSATVQTALLGLSSIGAGNVTVSGGPGNAAGSSPYTVTFTNGLGGSDVSPLTVSNGTTPLSGGSASATVATTVTGTGGNGFEVCTVAAECKIGISTLPGGGAFSAAQGIAVNQSTGNVYVTNRNFNRVDEFSSTGGFIRSWGSGVVTGGASGTGTLSTGSTAVASVATASKAFAIGQTVAGTGIPAGTQIVAIGAGTLTLSQPATASGAQTLTAAAGAGNVASNERQTVSIGGSPTGGTFTLSFKLTAPDSTTNVTTAAIPYNAAAAEVETALKGLSNIGSGNVAVSVSSGGNPGGGAAAGGPWTVEFTGARFADTNVEQLTSSPSGLTPAGGKTVTVSTAANGASAIESCVAAIDCASGQAGAVGGQFTTLGQLGIDSSGDIYVADSGNQRIQKFDEDGIFDRAWGWDVVQPGGTGEVTSTYNERQRIKISPAFGAPISSGTYTLTFNAATTAPISWNANASTVDAALEALPTVGAGNVLVSGEPLGSPQGSAGATFPVEFVGALASTDVPPIGIDVTNLCCADANSFKPTGEVVTFLPGGLQPGFEVCTVAVQCKAGTSGPGAALAGQFETGMPTSVAVGPSGNVYANDDPNARVMKFSPSGSALGSLTPGGKAPYFLAGSEESSEAFVSSEFSSPTEKRVEAFDGTDSVTETIPLSVSAINALGAGSDPGSEAVALYATTTTTSHRILKFAPVPPPDTQCGAATEVTATTAKLNCSIAIPSLGGGNFSTNYRFEYSADNGLNWTKRPLRETTAGPSPTAVSETVTDLQPNLTYRYRMVATTSTTSTSNEELFTTSTSKPSISHTDALPVTGTTAKLRGYINPNNSPTTYHFEWAGEEEWEESGEYSHQAPDFELFTGSGGQAVPVSVTIGGLQLATTYHFRLVGTNAIGTTLGPDATFTTNVCNGLTDTGLPDCRGFEQVSPSDKRPVGTVGVFSSLQVTYQSSSSGEDIAYPVLNGLSTATGGGNVEYLAQREGTGWLSTQLTAPTLIHPSAPSGSFNQTSKILYISPDLSCSVLESLEPLTSDTPAGSVEKGIYNLYKRDANGTYTLLTEPEPLDGNELREYIVDWATPDCTHVLFETGHRLLTSVPVGGGGLYEWANGDLRLVGILPDDSVASAAVSSLPDGTPSFAVAGGGRPSIIGGTTENAMSKDGSKVFFTALSNTGEDSGKATIFMRTNGSASLDISKSKTAIPNNGDSRFEGATPTGSHIFFLARYGLAASSSTGASVCKTIPPAFIPEGGEGCDLYDYEVENPVTHLPKLTDLSADSNPADSKGAGVIGMVDSSGDGSYVYFAARGQLIPDRGNTWVQNLATEESNVYLNHDGQLSFVGVINGNEAFNKPSGSNLSSRFEYWVADATPEGKYLVFISKANVTGYESGGVPMVYRYSAAGDVTTCVSCRPDLLPSVGSENTAPLTYRKNTRWGTSNVTRHRPTAMSADGRRIFFSSPDVLAAGAVSGGRNIYEWEQGKIFLLAAGGASENVLYADSSGSGDDAFVTTEEKLVPQDFDLTTDLYDARVKGGFLPPAVIPPCQVLEGNCEEPAAPQPSPDGGGPSESFVGPGNPPTTKTQTHKRHRHAKHGKKRSGRHRHARTTRHNQGGVR